MAKKLKVDDDMCIGCGLCVGSHPTVFEFNDDGKATVVAEADRQLPSPSNQRRLIINKVSPGVNPGFSF